LNVSRDGMGCVARERQGRGEWRKHEL
jgi:hypothetical protein